MHRLTLCILTIIATAATLWSCNDGDTAPGPQLLEQIATFDGNHAGSCMFSYRQRDDSPLITLSARGQIDESKTPAGTRLLVRYRLPAGIDPLTGGDVELVSLQKILTDTVEITSEAPAAIGELYLLSLIRSGEYLDIAARMPYTAQRRLQATATTGPDHRADLYIDATAGDAEQTSTAYMANAYGSISIGPLWERTDIDSIVVHVNNSNNIYRSTFTFKKTI
ncbi:MAG: hypothetical protein NC111_00695 [Bacteroides sp.]|nr:hypothetical protein [Bacteroides sp.]MCM1413855.1 hypothetical protein [Bacteroides sp.]MCM1471036.1 hypothetical protein [Bacteroides sp.]